MGGGDTLINVQVNDGISLFERRWVIQCKFHDSDISTNKISDINIPILLYSYKACGYLLICKKRPTSKLTDLLVRLEKTCKEENKYMSWSGEQFKRLILVKSNQTKPFSNNIFPDTTNIALKTKSLKNESICIL